MGISVEVKGDQEFERYQQLIKTLSDPSHKKDLLHALGAVVENQTKRRISDEKTAPDGRPWPDWSPQYEATRHGNQSRLEDGGDLRDSIQFFVERDSVRVGSPLAYARVHQEGFNGAVSVSPHTRLITQAFGKALRFPVYQNVSGFTRMMNIPQREFLGLSQENQADVYAVIGNFWQELMQ